MFTGIHLAQCPALVGAQYRLTIIIIIFKRFYLLIFRERGREGGREGKKQ